MVLTPTNEIAWHESAGFYFFRLSSRLLRILIPFFGKQNQKIIVA